MEAVPASSTAGPARVRPYMDLLHSYWRMDYVTSPKDDGDGHANPFRDLPARPDREFNYLVLNKYPYNPGHLLVVPYRELRDVSELAEAERNEMFALMVRAKEAVEKAMKPDGFNVGFNLGTASGAGIPRHLHLHIVPRWAGDNNFLSVIGHTRTLPQALEKTWERLRAFI